MKVYCNDCKYLKVSGIDTCSCEHKDNIEYIALHAWYRKGAKKSKCYIVDPYKKNRHNDCVLYKERKE